MASYQDMSVFRCSKTDDFNSCMDAFSCTNSSDLYLWYLVTRGSADGFAYVCENDTRSGFSIEAVFPPHYWLAVADSTGWRRPKPSLTLAFFQRVVFFRVQNAYSLLCAFATNDDGGDTSSSAPPSPVFNISGSAITVLASKICAIYQMRYQPRCKNMKRVNQWINKHFLVPPIYRALTDAPKST